MSSTDKTIWLGSSFKEQNLQRKFTSFLWRREKTIPVQEV